MNLEDSLMREPKRLAHRQAERNRARALKQWSRDDDEDLPDSNYMLGHAIAMLDSDNSLAKVSPPPYRL